MTLGRGLINSQSNAAVGGRRMSVIGCIADNRRFWPAMVCPLMTHKRHWWFTAGGSIVATVFSDVVIIPHRSHL